MKVSRQAIGLRIRALRKDANANQRDYADLLQVSHTTLSSYETGDAYPSIEVLARLVKTSGKSLDWIVFGATMPEVDQEEISEKEIRLLQLFREAKEADRELLLRMAELAAAAKKKGQQKEGL